VSADPKSTSPFAGDGSFAVVLYASEGGATAAVPVLERRLEALGVEGTVRAIDDRQIRLELHDVASGEAVANAVSPSGRLQMALVAADQGPLDPRNGPPPSALVTVRSDWGQGSVYGAPTREALAPLLERARGLMGREAVVECRDDPAEGSFCLALLIEVPPVIAGEDIADARVTLDEMTQRPMVMVDFDDEAASRFADVTGGNIGRKLAIVVDGRCMSSPVIQSAIPGGTAQITLATQAEYTEVLAEAHSLAAAFRAGALATPLRLGSVEPL
jgi:preprotein translocase subunit SecD